MAYHTVEDENGLVVEGATPEAPAGASTYIRLMSDPTLLQEGRSGDLYRRADGLPWEADGYRVSSDLVGRKEIIKRNRLA